MTLRARSIIKTFVIASLPALMGCGVGAATTAMSVRDGTVSANADASVIDATGALADAMLRVEQDQLVALSTIHPAEAGALKLRLAQARVDWAPAQAIMALSKDMHDRLKAELAKPAPNTALVQALVLELDALLARLYAEISTARTRITLRKD